MPHHYFLAKPSKKTPRKPRPKKVSAEHSRISPKITRGTGIPITIAGTTYGYAGGGYSGATKELDETVVRESEFMAKEFKKPVEIRFNSDKQSGGAWIRNQSGRLSRSASPLDSIPHFRKEWIGILTSRQKGCNRLLFKGSIDEIDELPKHVGYNTVVDKDALKAEALNRFNGPDNESSKHIFLNHPSLKAAADWIAKVRGQVQNQILMQSLLTFSSSILG